jgi:hypothetical protein
MALAVGDLAIPVSETAGASAGPDRKNSNLNSNASQPTWHQVL